MISVKVIISETKKKNSLLKQSKVDKYLPYINFSCVCQLKCTYRKAFIKILERRADVYIFILLSQEYTHHQDSKRII